MHFLRWMVWNFASGHRKGEVRFKELNFVVEF